MKKLFNINFRIKCNCGNKDANKFIVEIVKNFNKSDSIEVRYLCILCENSYIGTFALKKEKILDG